ncbi:MAG: T9SS type A sorting domain-containing protein [Bacteroidota bacterium]
MRFFALILLSIFLFHDYSSAQISTDNVFVLPIRKVKAGQDIEDFITKRDAYVALLEAETGTLTDREFQPFFEFTNSGLPVDSVFVGLTSFTDFQTFQEIGATTNGQVANDFFETFDFITFQVLQPLDTTEIVDLSDFANLGTGQVWEVAVRNISQYNDFDQADYEQKRDAYLAVLAAQNNFVREVQWQSISDPGVVVGMTVYKDAQSYASVNADTSFINAYLDTGFLQDYPINVYGAIHNPLKGTLDPGCQDIGTAAFPEDVTEYNGYIYTSNYFNGSITQKNLNTGEIIQFAPPATDVYNSAWGLRVDAANNRLLSIANQFYDFNPANAQAGKVNAYDIATGDIVGSWDLPSTCVGNSIEIDNDGNYFVGDIGPDTRIIKIDPITDEVTIWADDGQWSDGGFGTGGMVWNKTNGFYVAHAGVLWHVPQNTDGSAGAAVAVTLDGTTAIDGSNLVNADGMTWAGDNTIFYAENDVFTPGWHGIVHRVELSDATNGTNTNYIEEINDCSGVYFSGTTLYVNESQFGVAFGVNFVPTSNPFCVKTFEVDDIISSVNQIKTKQNFFQISPNPTNGMATITSKNGEEFQRVEVYTVEGLFIKNLSLESDTGNLYLGNLNNGVYIIKVLMSNGQSSSTKLILNNP